MDSQFVLKLWEYDSVLVGHSLTKQANGYVFLHVHFVERPDFFLLRGLSMKDANRFNVDFATSILIFSSRGLSMIKNISQCKFYRKL